MKKGSHHSESTKEKQRIASTGKNNWGHGRTGEKSPNWGRHPSEENIRKQILSHTGKSHTEATKQKQRIAATGKHPSEETIQKIRESKLGENNFWWNKHHSEKTKQILQEKFTGKGNPMFGRTGDKNPAWRGKQSSKYPPEFGRIAPSIRLRDNGLCVLCGRFEQSGRKPCVHHIDTHKENSDPLNLVTVCYSCHGKIHATVDSEQDYEIILSNWVRQKYGFSIARTGE